MSKKGFRFKLLTCILSIALVSTFLPVWAFAQPSGSASSGFVEMTEGDILSGFAEAGEECISADPAIAAVDENGNLKAFKAGTTVISVPAGNGGEKQVTVQVDEFDDGSETVGTLKIVARFNDSMQFYDGHVYLIFTSCQDGLTISVPDLYGAYEISDQYYRDIREDIANGSNHTGTDTDRYFTFTKDLETMTLNRGEAVSIGMYRGFDLSVEQAALGSLMNSSAWGSIAASGKAAVVTGLFQAINEETAGANEALEELMMLLAETGQDYQAFLDGVVEGGLCFNREFYNQKLEWDQYENVTYKTDITANQLAAMEEALSGNLNRFSILKNSCATVAVKAWNAAVGTRDGADTAYRLEATGDGIFAFMDAPKSVRDNIVKSLPGYYLNNAQNVAEPGAGYQDETGWVYVSAPEKISPVTYVYEDESLQIDTERSKMADLINAAKDGSDVSYAAKEQQVGVSVSVSSEKELTTISGIDFTVNGSVVSLNEQRQPSGGVWLKMKTPEGTTCALTDAEGKAVPSVYSDGWTSFYAEAFPFSFRKNGGAEGAKNWLKTMVVNEDIAEIATEVYIKNGGEKETLGRFAELAAGTDVYIKPVIRWDVKNAVVRDLVFNGASIMDKAHYVKEEDAYLVKMPENYSELTVTYDRVQMNPKSEERILQAFVNDTLDITDYAELLIGSEKEASDAMKWFIISGEEEGIVRYTDESQRAVVLEKPGTAGLLACPDGNEDMGIVFKAEVYETVEDMVLVTFEEEAASKLLVQDQDGKVIPYSGYLVRKGTALTVSPDPQEAFGMAISELTVNEETKAPGEEIVAEEDLQIHAGFEKASVTGMPDSIALETEDETFQLNAQTVYTGLSAGAKPVYDTAIRYESSDPLVTVDENGLVTVAGEIPEQGKAVYVTAYAGSSAGVSASSKVILGNYEGARIVGRLTIFARPVLDVQPVPHGAVAFTAYEDTALDISMYEYYRPNEKFLHLMEAYNAYPEDYSSDAALYSEDIPIADRESFFDVLHYGEHSEPQTVSLKKGDSISISNYGFDPANLMGIRKAIQNGTISASDAAQTLVQQMLLFEQKEEGFDGELAFDSLVSVLVQMYGMSEMLGYNPADGEAAGGITVNREIYNQFRRSDSQMPNNYYAVEITADEFAAMEQYLSNPENNYYNVFNKNCASGARDVWNAALSKRNGLTLKSASSSFMDDPVSLHRELELLREKEGISGSGGTDFYPRPVAGPEIIPGWKLSSNGEWIYLKSDGSLVKGWVYYNGSWYFLDRETGVMATGWVYDDGEWYLLSDSGSMITGWAKDGDLWYYLKGNGAMAAGEWVGGYWLSESGAWTYNAIGIWKQDAAGWWFGDTNGWYAAGGTMRIDFTDYLFDAAGYWIP